MRKPYALFVIVFVSSALSLSTGCLGDPAFTGGVRVKTVEQIVGIGGSQFPVRGVSYSADISGPVGPSNTGTIPHLDGVTGPRGISDHPKAETDVIWRAIVIWTRVIPNCGVATGSYYIPGGGGELLGICFQF